MGKEGNIGPKKWSDRNIVHSTSSTYLRCFHHSHHCHYGWAEPEGFAKAAIQEGKVLHLLIHQRGEGGTAHC